MPEQKQPQQLTIQQLLDEYNQLTHVPPRELTPEERERFKLFEVELKRREPEVWGWVIAGIEREAAQLPDPECAAGFAPAKLSGLTTSRLKSLLREKESQLELWKKAYASGIPQIEIHAGISWHPTG